MAAAQEVAKVSSDNNNAGQDTMTTSSKNSSEEPALIEKLVTHEDKFHIHKTCGILWIITVLIRFSLPSNTDMGFAAHPQFTIPTIVLHLTLSLSSFQFFIPYRRINRGDRIWPEYRLHALVFTCRDLVSMLLIWYENKYNIEPNYDINFIIVMSTLVFVDLVSTSVGKYHSRGLRGNQGYSPKLRFNYSIVQLAGTNACLFGFRRFTYHYLSIFILQWNPFMMTLRRKNIVSSDTVTNIYSAILTIGSAYLINDKVQNTGGWHEYFAMMIPAYAAILLRLGPRVPGLRIIQNNKYLMWLSIGLAIRHYRTWLLSDSPDAKRFVVIVTVVANFIILALGSTKSDKLDEVENGSMVDQKPDIKKV